MWNKYKSLVIFGFLILLFLVPQAFCLTEQLRKVPEKIKSEVKERDKFQCVLCESKNGLQVDHKIPLWQGGSNNPENLQTLCQHHHKLKTNYEKAEYAKFVDEIKREKQYHCSYCDKKNSPWLLTLEFKNDPKHGGTHTKDNLKPICTICHIKPKAIMVDGQTLMVGNKVAGTNIKLEAISENKVSFVGPNGEHIEKDFIATSEQKGINIFRIQGSVNKPSIVTEKPVETPKVAEKSIEPVAIEKPVETHTVTEKPIETSTIYNSCADCGRIDSTKWYRCPRTGRLYCDRCASSRGYVICY